MSVPPVELLQFHLERDLNLPKLTLRRWLKERMSHLKDAARWVPQKQLLERRSRSYTIREIRLLLKLGESPYRGFAGITPDVRDRLQESVEDGREKIVSRIKTFLDKHASATRAAA